MPKTHNKTGRSKQRGRYVEVPGYMLDSHAWQSLSVHARYAWLELMRTYYGSNNGQLGMGVRRLGKQVNCSKATAARLEGANNIRIHRDSQ
jgi:hypothetical protein